MTSISNDPAGEPRRLDHERSDVRFGSILAGALALLVLIVVVVGGAVAYGRALAGNANPLPAAAGGGGPAPEPPPGLALEKPGPLPSLSEPRVEVNMPASLAALRTSERNTLSSYGWVDQSKGVARIPIERAIELTAQRGLPTRPQAQGTQARGNERPSDASGGRMTERVR